MEYLRKIGGILARHYEKVLVVVALIGLMYAVYHLYSQKQAEEETIAKYNLGIQKKQTQGIPMTDMAALTNALEAAKHPPALNFGLPHNLFNPVKWQRRPDGSLLKVEKGTEVGPAAMKVVKVTPLNTTITLDRPAGPGLFMSAVQEASTNRALRVKRSSFVSSNVADGTKLFTLREIRGTADKPQAVVELATGEKVNVSADAPYTKTEGYRADLAYPPNNTTFNDKRIGDIVNLEGEDYIIVAINPNEVVVSARSNNRRTTIRNNAVP